MIKNIAVLSCLLLVAGCSDSDSSDNSPTVTTPDVTTPDVTTPDVTTPDVTTPDVTTPDVTTPDVTTPDVTTPGGDVTNTPANVTGTTSGVWFGSTTFGDAVVVINSAGQLTGLSNQGGEYEAVHGNITGALDRFIHQPSDNPASATSFRLVGDNPSTLPTPTADTITYNLGVTNDGQQLDNTGDAGAFSLTFATNDDVASISTDAIAGTWTALTSFAPTGQDIVLSVTFDQTGGMTGFSNYNNTGEIALTGTASAADDSNQYLNVDMTWNGLARTGAIHRERGTERLLLNTSGPDGDTVKSFSAFLTRQ